MAIRLEKLFKLLNKVIKNKVFYGTNVYDNDTNAQMPFIVYQEISKRPSGFSDDKPINYRSNIQITLVTKTKDLLLEAKIESALLSNGYNYSMISEYKNQDKSLNRIYEIYTEE